MDSKTTEKFNWSFHENIAAVFIDHLNYFMTEVMGLNEEEFDLRFAFNSMEFNSRGNKRIVVLVDVTGMNDATNYFPNETGSKLYQKGPHKFMMSTNAIINFITPDEIEGCRLTTQYFMQLKKYKNTFERFFHEVDPVGVNSAMLIKNGGNPLYNIPVQVGVLFNYNMNFEVFEEILEGVKVITKVDKKDN